MKTQNSVSQKIWMLHKINLFFFFLQKCKAFEKYVNFYALNIWLGLLLHELLHQYSNTVDFRKHSGPTPAEDMAAQIITDWKLHTGLQATWILCLSSLPPDSGSLIYKWNAKYTLIWKEDFGPLSSSPVLFLLSPGKMLLTMFLVQKCLGSPFPEDVWAWWLLMHWLQLQLTPCEALPSVWIGFTWQYSQACRHPCCLCTFSFPISSFQSTLHLICFHTALLEQPPLSVMTLCDLLSLWRVSMIVFWTTAKLL